MFLFVSVISSLISLASSTLILISAQRNVSVEFEDAEASFGAVITEDMPMGKISESSPLDACESVKPPPNGLDIFFALIHRGDCTFAEKVLAVQKANFSGAIIVNTESDYVFPMSSNATFNVNIPAIMVGRSSGKTIRSQYLFRSGYLARMKPNPGTVIEYYLVPFLITLSLAFFGIIIFLAFRVFRTCLRQSKNRLSRESLNKLPEIRYSEDYQNLYETCAICLEDYAMGDKLRVLPCHHAYHSKCVDRWLLRRQGSCPVCKFRINRNHDDVDTDADDNNVEEEDEEGAQPSNSLVDRTGSGTIEAPQPIDTASACETSTARGYDDSAPLLSKSAPSASWLSGGQLPSNGTAWLGYDNPAVETADELSEVKVDVQTRDLGSAQSNCETEEGEGPLQTPSPEEEEEGEHHKFLPTLDV